MSNAMQRTVRRAARKLQCVKVNINFLQIIDAAYLCVLAVYLFYMTMGTTLFKIEWPQNFMDCWLVAAFSVVFLKLGYMRPKASPRLFLAILTATILSLSWTVSNYDFLFRLGVLMIGAYDIPYKRILKVALYVEGTVVFTALLGSLLGVIDDLVFCWWIFRPWESGGAYRHSFGIIYTTDFAAHLTFLILLAWAIYGKGKNLFFLVVSIIGMYIVSKYCNAETAGIILLGVVLSILFIWCLNWINPPTRKCILKVIKIIFPVFVFFSAIIMLVLTVCYDPDSALLSSLNNMIHGRLYFGNAIWKKYGYKILGTPFEMIGSGYDTVNYPEGYDYVDSSYVLIALRYGWLVLLVICLIIFVLCKKFIKDLQLEAAFAIALVVLYCVMEHHMMELEYNPFILLPFAKIERDSGSRGVRDKYSSFIGTMFLGVGILIIQLVGPRIISYLKTVAMLERMWESEFQIDFVKICTWSILLLVLVCAICKWIVSSKHRYRFFSLGAMCVTVFISVLFCYLEFEQVIQDGMIKRQVQIERDDVVIQTLLDEGFEGRMFEERFPELYIRKYASFSAKALQEEGCIGMDDVVLLTDNTEVVALPSAGFVRCNFSESRSIYTNSEQAIEILKRHGLLISE